MDNVSADFTINENQPIQAEYTLGESEHFDCSFELFATGTAWGLITGNLQEQTDLWDVLSSKADTETVEQNLSAIEDEISDLSDTVDNNYTTLVNRLENDELAISNNSGEITSLSNTIQSYGDIVTYDASYFATSAQGALADTALQSGDNISELVNNVGYITSASLPTLEDLTTQSQLDAINSGATTSKINQIASNTQAISTETANRQNADNNLQSQIDAITASSDVTDIVGTYAQLQAYDTSTLAPNSIIKVLQDEHQNDETTYYRWVITGGVGAWVLIGEEGPYYTKSEADGRFVPQTRTINGKDLSNNISLDASDVGALPSSTVIPTVNNGTLDIQVNGTSVGTFTANQSGNTTANIVVPDSATWGNITGDLTDQTDLQDALDNKQDKLTAGTDLEIIAGSGAILPDTYEELEYIQSDGACYIDTGIISYGNDIIEQKFQKLGTDTATCSWFGSMQGTTLIRVSIGSYFRGSDQKFVFFGGFNYTQGVGLADTNEHIIKLYGGSVIELDGTSTVYTPQANTNPTVTSYLFARHGYDNVNTVYDNEGTRIFYHKQKRIGGTELLDLVPARRIADGELGFYNLVNNTFLTNSGSGALTGGNVVSRSSNTVINFTNESGYALQSDVNTALALKQDVLTAGTGIDITNNVISNTQTSAEWGNITGDIEDQTDLQTALDDKQDKLTAGTDLEIVVGSGASNTVSGTNSIILSNAAANSLSSVIVYGKCSQTGTPTTSNPVDIVCNNGAIKYNTGTSSFYTEGTVETVTDSLNNTATAEMLLGFGDYIDTQDLLGVGGTRKVGLMVLTGTEEFDTTTLTNCYSLVGALGDVNLTDRTVYCTHFQHASTLPAAGSRQGYALIGNRSTPSNAYTVGFGATTEFSTVALFKSWLATQYANGTPVIIAYRLATPTTFGAAAQTLNTKSGSNQLTITQSAISNLSIKATYTTDSTSTINFTNASGYIKSSALGNGTITITQGGVTKGTFTTNQSSNATIALDAGGSGGTITVDQVYDSTSANAQSGVAINGAGFATQSWVTSQGYTTNTGTVTSVNNIQPVNGNVTISIPTVPTNISAFNNDSGYITGITSSDVTTALGYIPYNSSNPNGYTSNVGTVTSVNNVQPVNGNVTITIPTVPTNVSAFTNDAGYITSSALSGYVPVSANSQTISATNGDFTINTYYSLIVNDTINDIEPIRYDSTSQQLQLFNSDSYPAVAYFEANIPNNNLILNVEGDFNINTIDSGADVYINSRKVLTASDVDQTYDSTSSNAQSGVAIANAGFLTGINSNDVTTALGYTPYNSSNPSGYITSSDLPTNHVTTDTDQNITGTKTFVGQKKIAFKQASSSDKLGFTLYNNSGTEKGYLEYNPSNTVDSVPLMTLGNYATASAGLAHVGFRKYSNISGANGAYNLLAPLISDAKTPFSLTTTYTNFYMPLGFTDGNSTVKTAKSGLVDLSSILPTVNNSTITFTQGGVTKGTITLNQSSNGTIALDAGGSGGIQNTATGTDSLTIMGTPTAGEGCINIGVGSQTSSYTSNVAIGAEYDADAGANARGDYGVSIGTATIADENAVSLGYHAQATGTTSTAIGSGTVASGSSSVSVGKGAEATAQRAIQIGEGINSTASSLKVGFGTSATNYQLLDGTTGLIPDARISSNIARTSQIPTVPTNISSFTNDSGYITGITGSDVTTALGYTPYNSTNPNGYITGVTSSDIITALGYTPANDTLSNLGATASPNFDGDWVVKNVTIAASVTWDSTTDDATYSLASQLPNDNYTYEVLITCLATSAATAGRFMTIQIKSDVQTSYVYVCNARSLSTIQNQAAGAVLIRVGSARTITQYSSTATAANGTYSLYLKGYRRVGTNT